MRLSITIPAWVDEAACANQPADIFYPDQAGENCAEAVAICAGCDVREQCLAYAMDYEAMAPGSRYGVWGGLSPRARRTLALTVRPTCPAETNGRKDTRRKCGKPIVRDGYCGKHSETLGRTA